MRNRLPQVHAKKSAVREPYVIDVWYDSGAAQFAQWNTTSLDNKALADQWPSTSSRGPRPDARLVLQLARSATALGQTAPDSPLFKGPAFRNCLVGGLNSCRGTARR